MYLGELVRAESPAGPLGWRVASTAISADCKDESNFHGDGLPNLGTHCAQDSSMYLALVILKG